jgi:GNAT superfamily N-acetyltransferase
MPRNVLAAALTISSCAAFIFGPQCKITVCETALLPAVADAFVDSFWVSKSEIGSLSDKQRTQLLRDQLADFKKRYSGGGADLSVRRGLLLVATTGDGDVLGCAGIDLASAGALPRMSNLAVSRRARKRGLGGRLVRACEDTARDAWGADELDLEVGRDDVALVCFICIDDHARIAARNDDELN